MDDFPSWQQGIRLDNPPLNGLHRADVAIVGGGLTGVTTAMLLAEQGLRVVLAEAHRLGDGAAWACAGIVTAQLGQAYHTVIDLAGLDAASAFARMVMDAVESVHQAAKSLDAPCQARETDVYTYAFLKRDLPALERQLTLQRRLGLPVSIAPDAGSCPFPVELSLLMPRQFMLSPLGYLMGMAEQAGQAGCVIGEQSPVRAVEEGRLLLEDAVIEAPTILLATGVPIGCKALPVLAMTTQRVRETVVLRGGAPFDNCHISVRDGGLTLRPLSGGYLTTWTLGRPGFDRQEREELLDRVLAGRLPESSIVDGAIRQDVWSRDGLPLIGSIRERRHHLLMATGYSGYGVTGSMLAAQVLTRRILGRPLPEDAIFNPNRRYPSAKAVVSFGARELRLTRRRSRFRLRSPVCPHMGCRLRYSHATGKWECPCHGATFSVLGENVDGPAMRPIRVTAKDRPG
ncbi:MAG: FAD-dependent oxidoreductase [Christensenellaceae bacterium]|nr:FAD-dependent oxidoreductase [Christensenellaceae bacterium]